MINFKKISYVILNIFMLLAVIFSVMIYTSLNPNLPWYESCGTQFLAIFLISDPMLGVIYSGFIILKVMGYKFTKINFRLPIYILLGLSLPLIIDGRLGIVAICSGIVVCIISIIKIIVDIVTNFKLQNTKVES
ncbi:hypothetical protein G8V03_07430 [Clostridium botulinum D/C]|uniref:hypothetical protein n=1 Tax=Clostridium botulinum TaxID=1491 RepID=UPI001E49AD05|nr:hypothetical protein [Clostridium botulinum]MCD3350763.1 hypothetical protein [Clostridium botulinum D/C]MCD3359784.1 hypothetical protein [Clostridium botulinum D/C]MCD3362396.1 hypothetical protein [Clostridium botulinum D/C]MCD3365481.1 hypothetical protein [Clostridium botulinum D/C]